jgi:hypothetical protein
VRLMKANNALGDGLYIDEIKYGGKSDEIF